MVLSKYAKKRKCKSCGAIIAHNDTFCHKCLEEIEDKHPDHAPEEFRDRI